MLNSGQGWNVVPTRMPPTMEAGVQLKAEELGVTRSEVVRLAVMSYLSGMAACSFSVASGFSGVVSLVVNGREVA